MNDEIFVLSAMDQDNIAPILDEHELIQRVQDEINRAADAHDVDLAVRVCAYFYSAAKLSGKSLAHALYTMERRWDDFKIGENFIDYIFAKIGLARFTVERYLKVSALINEHHIPDKYAEEIESKGIQQLIPIAHAIAQGFKIEDESWEQLLLATNEAEVRDVINRDVKNALPREGSLRLVMSRTGSIMAYKGDASPKFIGSLELEDTDPVVQQAVERVVKNAGILRQ